ncbi:MAG TPA: hypothetical protein VFA22_09950 [Stellaceae bacterium]|nr:hypothetical protein [Stellaceae bacterium]
MSTMVLRQLHRVEAPAATRAPRSWRFPLRLPSLRRRPPTLFQKCLAIHMANAPGAGRLR